MINYDKTIHIPQLVEMFAQDFHNGDIEKLQNTKTLLVKLIDDNNFQKKIQQIETINQNKTQELFKKSRETLKNHLETKNPEDLFLTLPELQNTLNIALIQNERNYWETIYSEITKNIEETDEG